jgi:HNH endonuclease
MIPLTKRAVPPDLAQKLARKTARYLSLRSLAMPIPKSLASGYNDPKVKRLLREETADKCAYCESKIPHVDYGDIEHMISKDARPDLRFSFDNLTFACGVCNTKKHDYDDPNAPLLNPYRDNPNDHLKAFGPMVMRLPTSDRGLITQKRLDLNRPNLVERRTERLESIGTLLDQIARTTNPSIKQVLEDQVQQECGADKEYAFVVRGYVGAV